MLLAGLADFAAHHRRRLHFQIHVFGSGLDGLHELILSEFFGSVPPMARRGKVHSLLRERLSGIGQQAGFPLHPVRKRRNPARRNQRHVGFREQFLDLLPVQVAQIQPDLRHLHLTALENVQDLVQRLVLYGSTNHIFNVLIASSTVRSRITTEPMRSGRTKCTRPPSAFLSLSMAAASVSSG